MNDKGAQSTDFERMIWAAAWAVALRNGNLAIDAMREAHTAVSAFRNLVENDQRISPDERKFLEGLLGSGPQHRSKTVIESVACPGCDAAKNCACIVQHNDPDKQRVIKVDGRYFHRSRITLSGWMP